MPKRRVVGQVPLYPCPQLISSKNQGAAAHDDLRQSPPRRRRLSDEDEDSDEDTPDPQSVTQSNLQTMTSKLVRLALSAEYARIPIRRTDIATKVLGDNNSRHFKAVFDGAQKELQSKFGMQLIELPGREKEKMGIAQRRGQLSSIVSTTSVLPLPFRC